MAEGVIIEDLGPGIPRWMSEVTAEKMLRVLREQKIIQSKSEAQLRKIERSLAKLGDSGSNSSAVSTDDLNEALNELEQSVNSATSSTNNFSESTNNSSEDVRRLGSSADSTSSKLKSFAGGAMSILATAVGVLTGAFINQYKTALQINEQSLLMNDTTGNTTNALGGFGSAASRLNLSFSDLLEVTGRYSAVINQYGIRDFTRMSVAVTSQLRDFGITNKEATEITANYLENLSRIGLQTNLNDKVQMAIAKRQMTETVKWSFILGKSRQQMEEQIKAGQASASAQLYLALATEKQREAYTSASLMLGEGSEQLLAAITSPVLQATQVYQDMLKTGSHQAAAALEEWANTVKNGASSDEQMAALRKLKENLPIDQLVRLKNQFGVVDDSTVFLINSLRQLDNQTKKTDEANAASGKTTEQRIKAEQASAKAAVHAQNAFTNFTQMFNRAVNSIFNTPTGAILNDAVIKISDHISKLSVSVSGQLGPLIQTTLPYVLSGITSFVNLLISGVERIKEFLKGFENSDGTIRWKDAFSTAINKAIDYFVTSLIDAILNSVKENFPTIGWLIDNKEKVVEGAGNAAENAARAMPGPLGILKTIGDAYQYATSDSIESEPRVARRSPQMKHNVKPGRVQNPSPSQIVISNTEKPKPEAIKEKAIEKVEVAKTQENKELNNKQDLTKHTNGILIGIQEELIKLNRTMINVKRNQEDQS